MKAERWTDEQLQAFAELLRNPDAALALLSKKDRREYERCRDSVIEARRAGERLAHTLWIS